jgi:hypothetical protein
MTDSIIIWNFLTKEYQNDSPVVFLYVCGNVRSPKTAIDRATDLVTQIFHPTIPEYIIRATIKGFFEMKKKQYMRGEFKPKPIY